jgi:hypothetical protein
MIVVVASSPLISSVGVAFWQPNKAVLEIPATVDIQAGDKATAHEDRTLLESHPVLSK